MTLTHPRSHSTWSILPFRSWKFCVNFTERNFVATGKWHYILNKFINNSNLFLTTRTRIETIWKLFVYHYFRTFWNAMLLKLRYSYLKPMNVEREKKQCNNATPENGSCLGNDFPRTSKPPRRAPLRGGIADLVYTSNTHFSKCTYYQVFIFMQSLYEVYR
jgi:hypothetical protein